MFYVQIFRDEFLKMPLHFFLEFALFFPYIPNKNCQVKKNETKKTCWLEGGGGE
jgi:hypothetical protein